MYSSTKDRLQSEITAPLRKHFFKALVRAYFRSPIAHIGLVEDLAQLGAAPRSGEGRRVGRPVEAGHLGDRRGIGQLGTVDGARPGPGLAIGAREREQIIRLAAQGSGHVGRERMAGPLVQEQGVGAASSVGSTGALGLTGALADTGPP